MKIKHIEAIPLVRELENAFQGGTYRIVSRNTIVARVELEDGTVGEVFGGDEDQYHHEVAQLVNEHYRPLLVGEDVRDVEKLWSRMWDCRVDFGNRGIHTLDLAKHCIHTQAIAAADMALWDALGKALDQPVYKLLGGFRDRVPVIAIGGYMNAGTTPKDLEDEVLHYIEQGVGGMKLKVGKNTVEEDLERAGLVRKVAGSDFHLCVDANQSWTVEDALAFAHGAGDLDLAWIEEPCRWHDQIEGNARVRQVGIPVNAGQGEISRHGCRELIVRGAVDILNVDATIAAGVTEWRRIAAMAHCLDVRMAHHEEPQVALHLLAGVPNGICVEIFPSYQRDPMWFDLPVQQPVIENGQILVPAGPGFGLPLNPETIDRWRSPSPS
jgi:L-alanine-DL-glutamate epimerase-like enolase superfamily enzyme